MKIAIASGKGGAGKTSITSALLRVWDNKVIAVDADVEAPNLHLFIKPDSLLEEQVFLPVPKLNSERCIACGACRDICQFKAIIKMGKSIQIFPEMCHGCGGCYLVCEQDALEISQRELGSLFYQNTSLPYLMGKSRIGEAMTPPLLKAMQEKLNTILKQKNLSSPHDVLIDSPPGVSCPAMTVTRESDLIILVAEPSPFGFYDFKLAHKAFKQLHLPIAVIMNKTNMQGNEEGDALLKTYCQQENLTILGNVPFEADIAKAYANGYIFSELSTEWKVMFQEIVFKIRTFIKENYHG